MGYFCQKIFKKLQLKKLRRVIFHDTQEGLVLVSNDMRNFVNFDPTTQKSKNLTLLVYSCAKYIVRGLS